MDQRFAVHNAHWNSGNSPQDFERQDPHLKQLNTLPYVFYSALLQEFPTTIAGIYTFGGGRQIGKTTLLKQWMLQLMKSGVSPQSVLFLRGEMIDDHHNLIHTIQSELALMDHSNLCFVIIDEITYIKDKQFWPIEIKWTKQLMAKDLKQIQKYKNGLILSKSKEQGMIFEIPSIPLPEFLYNF